MAERDAIAAHCAPPQSARQRSLLPRVTLACSRYAAPPERSRARSGRLWERSAEPAAAPDSPLPDTLTLR
eukprot:8148914-Pyramimonas_sp.AAC.1